MKDQETAKVLNEISLIMEENEEEMYKELKTCETVMMQIQKEKEAEKRI